MSDLDVANWMYLNGDTVLRNRYLKFSPKYANFYLREPYQIPKSILYSILNNKL